MIKKGSREKKIIISEKMSIEVHAVLEGRRSVFLTVEQVKVQILFKNCHQTEQKSLAWGCVQLHCDETTAKIKKNSHATSTAVPKSKHAIFSSEPAILFCDISIDAGKSQKFECTHQIPFDNPPSFKGHFVRYFWYISVAAQQVDAPIKMVQLPIKVLNIGVDVGEQKRVEENPFLKEETTSPSIAEMALNRIEEICSIRKQRVYEMNSGGNVFVKIVLSKNIFRLGDDIIGKLEFSQDDVRCLQILIRAETVETNLVDDQKGESITSHSTEHAITAFIKETYFKVQLPLTSVPSFTTEFVKLRWRLHFEFVTTDEKLLVQSGAELSKLAENLNIQTMKWDLPINVLTCSPFSATSVHCSIPPESTFAI